MVDTSRVGDSLDGTAYAGEPVATPSGAPAAAAAGIQILVVEDDGLVAMHITRSLIRLGYSVVGKAATGEEAACLAAVLQPDIVLMDILLRGPLDGIATAMLIRTHSTTPVIFLTAFSDQKTLARAMQSHPFGYIVKPFQDVDLRCAIEVAVHRHLMEEGVRVSEQAFRRLSSVDELTGLPNRRGFCELAEQQLKIASRYQTPLVLCFVDLDGLKGINDQLGHAAGDAAIRSAASVLRDTFRGADIVGRLGGDEFAVLAIASSQATLDGALRRLSSNLYRMNETPLPFRLELSIGMARHDAAFGGGLEDLIDRADATMYENKQLKRSSVPASPDTPRPVREGYSIRSGAASVGSLPADLAGTGQHRPRS